MPFQGALASLPIRIDRVAVRQEKFIFDVRKGIFPAEAFPEVICLTPGWPTRVAPGWRQFDALVKLVHELLYWAPQGSLAHNSDSELIRSEYLRCVRTVF